MKAKHLILATLLLWAALPARALVYGIFEYEISGTRAVIKGLTAEGANSTTIDVPGLIPRSNGYHPYTTIIGTGAFKNNTKLKKVTLKWGCCMLEASAFEGCTALTELRIPSSMLTGAAARVNAPAPRTTHLCIRAFSGGGGGAARRAASRHDGD